MSDSENTTGGCSAVLSSDGLCVGARVRLVKSIYDDGEDHHPPGWIAHKGEIVFVKAVRCGDVLAVAHEGNLGAFLVYPGEYAVPASECPAPSCDECHERGACTAEEKKNAREAEETHNAKVSGAGTASAGLPGYAGDNNGE